MDAGPVPMVVGTFGSSRAHDYFEGGGAEDANVDATNLNIRRRRCEGIGHAARNCAAPAKVNGKSGDGQPQWGKN